MDHSVKTPQTEVANATAAARHKSGMKRPKKLVKGSAAAKRWMAHVRSHRRVSRKAKSPARKNRKKSTKGKRTAHKTPKRRHAGVHKSPPRGKAKRKGGSKKKGKK